MSEKKKINELLMFFFAREREKGSKVKKVLGYMATTMYPYWPKNYQNKLTTFVVVSMLNVEKIVYAKPSTK